MSTKVNLSNTPISNFCGTCWMVGKNNCGKVKTFIEILPKTLNQTAISTYEMILKEGMEQGLKINEELLIKAQLRAEEERLPTEEALLREEEEHRIPLGKYTH